MDNFFEQNQNTRNTNENENENENDEDNDDIQTIILDETYEKINHTHFQKYLGVNRYLVFFLLKLFNPTKNIVMYNKEYLARFIVPITKNTINIIYNHQNKVLKITCNTMKKIE